ncbi:MAG: helix-turn-helix transcriptional regulator [Methylocystaceae bacterium]|nr:helix-turn-helix transcriptional regulator [Methylocystaceae bacterium]
MAKKSIDFTVDSYKGKAFAERLSSLFEERGTVPRLHKELGIAASTMWKWAKGETEPARDHLIAISEALDVNFAWLALGEGPMRGHSSTKRNTIVPGGSLDASLIEEAVEFVREIEQERRLILANHNFAKAVMAYYGYVLECREKDEKVDKIAMKHAMKAAM